MAIVSASQRVRFIGLRAAPLVLIVALVVLFLPSAQAVHLEGNLELDTPSANVTNGGPTAGEDWENICYEVLTDADCGTTTGSTADDVAWAEDGSNGFTSDPSDAPTADASTIFTGGGSKDTDEIGNWAYKNDGGLPDKDNILHAFAAKYGNFLYFGMDRWSNDGDAQLGFWFFKNPVSLTNIKSGGGFEFAGDHAVGDLLILSDFSNGGTVSTIKVYEWQEPCTTNCASTNLHIIADTDDPASCDGADVNDQFCGIVNTAVAPTPSEWAFTDKSGNSDEFAQGELFEGGIDLSTIAPNTCFASFMVESRASTSPTATLKDFVLAPEFGGCESEMSSDQSWTPEDSATVGVTGLDVWGGSVVFKLVEGGTCDPETGTTGTVRYTSSAVTVSNTDDTASTDDAASPPPTIDEDDAGSSTTYWWFSEFTPNAASASAGVEGAATCEKTTIAIDDTP